MTELKTVKDMEKSDIEIGFIVEVIELKQEAIKWVKFYRNAIEEKKKLIKVYGCLEEDIIKLKSKCEVLIEFFNLTEEDLK